MECAYGSGKSFFFFQVRVNISWGLLPYTCFQIAVSQRHFNYINIWFESSAKKFKFFPSLQSTLGSVNEWNECRSRRLLIYQLLLVTALSSNWKHLWPSLCLLHGDTSFGRKTNIRNELSGSKNHGMQILIEFDCSKMTWNQTFQKLDHFTLIVSIDTKSNWNFATSHTYAIFCTPIWLSSTSAFRNRVKFSLVYTYIENLAG